MSFPENMRFSLVFYVPPSAAEACKNAVFKAGAGRDTASGKFVECCWTAAGTSQFRPIAGAAPYMGRVGALEQVSGLRIEMVCVGIAVVKQAVAALKRAHPYEEPIYQVVKLENF